MEDEPWRAIRTDLDLDRVVAVPVRQSKANDITQQVLRWLKESKLNGAQSQVPFLSFAKSVDWWAVPIHADVAILLLSRREGKAAQFHPLLKL
jgi:hypothetical protein